MRAGTKRALTVAAAASSLIVLASWLMPVTDVGRGAFDMRVYRGAVEAMLNGQGLYQFAVPDIAGPAPFLYPPFAALLMLPMVAVPFGSAVRAWMLIQIGLAFGVVALLARRSGWRVSSSTRRQLAAVLAVLTLVLLSRPVMTGVAYGQVSLAVTVLVIVDALLLPPRWRGCLTGLAAAIKLTPLLFVVFWFVSGQRRAAAAGAATFAVATAVGFVALPRESVEYWTGVLFDSSRVPGQGSQRNLSILGALQFWEVPAAVAKPLWLLLAGAVVVVSVWRASRIVRSDPVAATLSVGLATAMASPVCWDHFLVWLPLAGAWLVFTRRLPAAAGWALLVGCGVFSPIWPGALPWTPPLWMVLAGSLPVVGSVALSIWGMPGKGESRDARPDTVVASVPA